jgi:hypothetical protein
VPDIEVDCRRLGQEAGALASRANEVASIRGSLEQGVATAANACGTIADGGLKQALQAFKTAWEFDIAAVSSDVQAISTTMQSLSSLYDQADTQGAQGF